MQNIIPTLILQDYPRQFHLVNKAGLVYYIKLQSEFVTYYKLGYTGTNLHERIFGSYNVKSRMQVGGMGVPKYLTIQ